VHTIDICHSQKASSPKTVDSKVVNLLASALYHMLGDRGFAKMLLTSKFGISSPTRRLINKCPVLQKMIIKKKQI